VLRIEDLDRFVFIVGAPRCGTTTLSRFLKTHPSISFPVVKEPHFFAQHDLRGVPETELRSRVEREYLQRFFRPDADRRVGADASVTYLYAPEQLEPVLRLWPNSRFVVSLRNPLTMLPSLHQRLIYIGDETIGSFEKAWAAISARANGRKIPRRCNDPRWLRYDEAAKFATYLERLFAVVGRERCDVLIFDDLISDPAGQYRRLMEFIGLEPMPQVDLKARRAGQSVRSRWLQRMLKQPPPALKEFLLSEQSRTRFSDAEFAEEVGQNGNSSKAILSVRKRLLRWNRASSPPESLSPTLQVEISRHLSDEVEKLGSLLGRDLTHWLQPGSGSQLSA